MTKVSRLLRLTVIVGVGALVLASCGSGSDNADGDNTNGDNVATQDEGGTDNADANTDDSETGGTDNDSGDNASVEGTRACVILPETDSGPRWENFDRKYLTQGLEDAGFEADVQNALGDVNKFSAIGDQMLTKGCGVMILTDHQGAAEGVAKKAHARGVPVIAYDRPTPGVDYYVSFDNVKVGELEGQMVVDGLKAEDKDPADAVVVYMGGDPADGNAKMFHDGAVKAMEAAGITPAAEPPGVWSQEKTATNFEQALTSLDGKVDAVWSANDANAAGVIQILQKHKITGVPISGQDANLASLQYILTGWQTGTVYKPVKTEADAAVKLAIQLLNGEKPEADQQLDDGTPYIAVTPISVGPEQVKDVVAAGDADPAELCAGDVAAACDKYGIDH